MSEDKAVQQTDNKLVVAKKEIADVVAIKVKTLRDNGELFFPANYIPENAMKSAWLIIQDTVDMDKRPVLEVCTQESVINALFSMVIQGLNPDKKQCYFIAYGKKLTMQRSYFGSVAVAKTVDKNIQDVFAEVVYSNDVFEYSKVRGKNIITKHTQKLENIKKDSIIAAYATVLYTNDREETTIMTLDEIKQSWRQSKMNPVLESGAVKAGSTHDKFMAEMCRKTVTNRACKTIINSSDDSNIVARYARAYSSDIQDAEVEEEIEDKANKEAIDISTGEIVDIEEVPQNVPDSKAIAEPTQKSTYVATTQQNKQTRLPADGEPY